jgi:hypothetical protein
VIRCVKKKGLRTLLTNLLAYECALGLERRPRSPGWPSLNCSGSKVEVIRFTADHLSCFRGPAGASQFVLRAFSFDIVHGFSLEGVEVARWREAPGFAFVPEGRLRTGECLAALESGGLL